MSDSEHTAEAAFKAAVEMAEHVRTQSDQIYETRTEVGRLGQQFTLVQAGFQSNVDAQARMVDKLDGITLNTSLVMERQRIIGAIAIAPAGVLLLYGMLRVLREGVVLLQDVLSLVERVHIASVW